MFLRFNKSQKLSLEKFNILLPRASKKLLRLGRKEDGGYVIDKNIVNKVKNLVTFGMANEFSFELDLLNINNKVRIYIFDHTVRHSFYLKKIFKSFRRLLKLRHDFKSFLFTFFDYFKFLNFIYNKRVKFFCLKIVDIKKDKIEITPGQVFRNLLSYNSNVLLKIDIEGDEYKIIKQILSFHNNIDLILIEFHNIKKKKQMFLQSIDSLNRFFYTIHIHGNNHSCLGNDGFPDVVELTLINKKKYVFNNTTIKNYPLKNLDFPNNPYKKDIMINFD